MSKDQTNPRVLSFYLPQFHPTPENDEWWGKGFTEWTNVSKARPLFRGHYQPHLPADLGFYDLRLPETRAAQAELAKSYGINGFCYYHYWFHGRRMLNRVFDEVHQSGEPDFPFAICWANESWTKTWVGGENDVLIKQTYSDEDDLAHIRYLIPIFQDRRYIRVNGRPLFVIYNIETLGDRLPRLIDNWNKELQAAGLPELYLCCVRLPPPTGIEASINFFPNFSLIPFTSLDKLKYGYIRKLGTAAYKHTIASYAGVVKNIMDMPRPDYRMYHCPVPSWDNTARRTELGSLVLRDSTPEVFQNWLEFALRDTRERFEGEEQLVFINAWNEWAEGTHLEPDQKWGHAYLEAVRDALGAVAGSEVAK
jgi:lipopolysaccharide biosynthesis protein